jgi:GntR family transcriptional repressor for pyruvate dehydrogenase complex
MMHSTLIATPEETDAGLVDRLTDLIRRRELRPGDKLPPIRDLATDFGVKAGEVRDALLQAQGRGLVRVVARSGAYVKSVAEVGLDAAGAIAHGLRTAPPSDQQNLFHLLEAREAIELDTARRAAERRELRDLHPLRRLLEQMASLPDERLRDEHVELDIQFHLEIARLSRNQVLTALLETVLEPLRPRLRSLSWEPGRRSRTHSSHTRLYMALVDGDAAAMQTEIRSHMRQAYDSLLEEVRRPPETPAATP